MPNDKTTVKLSNEIFQGKRILLVDDDARNVFALKSVLQKKGFEIVEANTGQEAIDCLHRESANYFDIVLMDIMMPEMDGYEAMRRIRAHETLTEIPVIALTAKAMKGDREKCIEAGATDYVSKPIDLDHLLSMMRALWGE
jgi:two-component system, chemotaxis family, sensor kinase CheA